VPDKHASFENKTKTTVLLNTKYAVLNYLLFLAKYY